jgi:hypothetical protein
VKRLDAFRDIDRSFNATHSGSGCGNNHVQTPESIVKGA